MARDEAGERVAVVDRAWAEARWSRLEGHCALEADDLAALEEAARYEPRAIAETCEAWLQIIPYAAVVRGGHVFVMERLQRGGEKRLAGRRSIGVGGHVNPVDGEGEGLVVRALRRELREEVGAAGGVPHLMGRIFDGSSAVGRVHLGVTWRYEASDGERIEVRETEKLVGGFEPLETLDTEASALETWSRWLGQSLAEIRNSSTR